MKEMKPEWYGRMMRGPFLDTFAASDTMLKVEQKLHAGRASSKRRRASWTAAAIITLLVLCGISLYPQIIAQLSSRGTVPSSGIDQSAITHGDVKQRLHIGMSEEEVIGAFGKPTQEGGVRRDFAQTHREDPNDINTWSEVDLWRYDFGVREGYKAGSDDAAYGFDLSGIAKGDIKSQLVIVWKDGKVARALYRYGNSGSIIYSDISPAPAKP
ncbi:hypothetical protein SD71_17210 [Cohnella kolymensis]|uniref:DUF4367 domain-containing protein n=1 Tax=Cohnella kolymensis TaxID=1590652 RepID=A0ABR5A288_9BACL|nr:hypothetical protein [Cohnella kolymensis]KIL34778.1 hypothetical protein SD71_17210 [Cohnella kolymensis]